MRISKSFGFAPFYGIGLVRQDFTWQGGEIVANLRHRPNHIIVGSGLGRKELSRRFQAATNPKPSRASAETRET
jgi:hypothetical protein